MAFKINVVNYNEQRSIRSSKIALFDLLRKEDLKRYYAAKVNNRLRELTYEIHYDANIEFIDLNDSDACSVYERSLRFLFCMAAYELYPNLKFRLSYSISRSILVSPLHDERFENEKFLRIKEKMDELIEADLDFVKQIVPASDAAPIYNKYGYDDKIEILKYRPESTVHFYKCKNYKNYMYGIMVPSTGYLKNYKLLPYSTGLILQYPRSENEGNIPPFIDSPVFGKTLKESYRWGKLIGANSIAKVNESVKEYGDITFANICEARHNRQMVEIGSEIEKNMDHIKLICVAGPSSSGKTTFANKLRIELLSRGIRTIRVSIDDYYKLRKDVPLDEDGKPDLESIYALNIERFNEDMVKLIQGERVTLPHYNFKKGIIEDGATYQLREDEVIIIEGIHALNNMLTENIIDEQKYRIYIAPQAQIFLDDHNPMSLTDLRLIRRMVRDYKFRNSPAVETLSMWRSVRKGEFKWIYDTQENANYVYNSFLQYELSVLKKYALPLLVSIKKDDEYFPMAERLIRLLKHFVDMDDSVVPNNSLIREFIGGSVYESML